MYKSLDTLIEDSSVYKAIAERHRSDIDDLERSFEIVKQFIVERKRIIYGGMSIDLALKAAGDVGIYSDDSIPDYDMMSPDAYGDSIELAQRIADVFAKESRSTQVSAINALHPTTRRIRIGFTPVADITHYPADVYKSLPTLEFRGFRVIHPNFQRLDMHRAFTVPMEQPPREAAFHRMRKDIKRFALLDTAYPIVTEIVPESMKKQSGATDAITIDMKQLSDGVVGGFVAYAVWLADIKDAGVCQIDITVNNQCHIKFPKALSDIMCCNVMTDDFSAVVRGTDIKYRNRYLEDLKPRSVEFVADGVRWDIYDVRGRLTPYGVSTVLPNCKIATLHTVCLYFLTNYFMNENDQWMWLYWSALQLLKRAGPDAYKTDLYGFYNWSYAYIINSHRQLAQVQGVDVKLLPVARPPHGYYIEPDSSSKTPPQAFDPATSWVFAMDGSECEKFDHLTPEPQLKTIGGGNDFGTVIINAFADKTFKPVNYYQDIGGSMPYQSPKPGEVTTNCHAGQRKLLLSEIDFYSSHVCDFVIYAGSANGEHTDIILKMFPKIKLLLIDPAYHSIQAEWALLYQNLASVQPMTGGSSNKKNTKDRNRSAVLMGGLGKSVDILQTARDFAKGIKTAETKLMDAQKQKFLDRAWSAKDILGSKHRVFIVQDYLTPALADHLADIFSGVDKLYVSDLRTTQHNAPTDTDYVWNDALNIYAVTTLNPIASMLKFHPPYFVGELNLDSTMLRDLELVQPIVDMAAEYRAGKHKMFAGTVALQAWAPANSAETRLIVTRDDAAKPLEYYSHAEWDDKFYYLNRMRTYAYFDAFIPSLASIRGGDSYDGCFDCTREITILSSYLTRLSGSRIVSPETVKQYVAANSDKLLKLSQLINKELPHPSIGSTKCLFHGQIQRPLTGLHRFEVRDSVLYRVSLETNDAEPVDFDDPMSLRIADNADPVSQRVLGFAKYYIKN
jgi:hypothetical protein